jgi:rhodanese-related sulfurtransferase
MPKSLNDLVADARARVQEISADDLQEALEEGEELLLVDIREPYEYAKGHIPGTLLIPRGLLEGAADPNNPHRIEALHSARERPVVVLCNTGGRAAMAADTLMQMGFGQVRSLAGGLKMWEAEDYDMEAGEYSGPLP